MVTTGYSDLEKLRAKNNSLPPPSSHIYDDKNGSITLTIEHEGYTATATAETEHFNQHFNESLKFFLGKNNLSKRDNRRISLIRKN